MEDTTRATVTGTMTTPHARARWQARWKEGTPVNLAAGSAVEVMMNTGVADLVMVDLVWRRNLTAGSVAQVNLMVDSMAYSLAYSLAHSLADLTAHSMEYLMEDAMEDSSLSIRLQDRRVHV
jgi:hypothetical protein